MLALQLRDETDARSYPLGRQLFRASPRTGDAVLCRDVGALQLLRDARTPHLVDDGERREGGAGFSRGEGRRDLRFLHGDGVLAELAGWMGGGPHLRTTARRAVWRNFDRRGAILSDEPGRGGILCWP